MPIDSLTTTGASLRDRGGQRSLSFLVAAAFVAMPLLALFPSAAASSPASRDLAIEVDLGTWHSCAIVHDQGNVYCWGHDGYGQSQDHLAGDAAQLSVGPHANCILRTDGQPLCWGYDHDGTNPFGDARGLKVATGYGFACLLQEDGNILCTGSVATHYGFADGYQSGDAVDVMAAGYSFCAVRADGGTTCRGWGIESSHTSWTSAGIGEGGYHLCSLQRDGNKLCMDAGYHSAGQYASYLGGDAIDMAAAWWYSCALTADGVAHCVHHSHRTNPESQLPQGQMADLSIGGEHYCWVTFDGVVGCDGQGGYRNYFGQLDVPEFASTPPNAPPTLELAATGAIEGSPAALAVTIADADEADTHTLAIDWGDGATTSGAASTGAASYAHTYADDGTYAVQATVTDSAGDSASASAEVVVENGAPIVALTLDATTVRASDGVAGTADVADPGADTLTLAWSDGASDTAPAGAGPTAATFAHNWTLPMGVHVVGVTVSDDEGASGSADASVVVRGAGLEAGGVGPGAWKQAMKAKSMDAATAEALASVVAASSASFAGLTVAGALEVLESKGRGSGAAKLALSAHFVWASGFGSDEDIGAIDAAFAAGDTKTAQRLAGNFLDAAEASFAS